MEGPRRQINGALDYDCDYGRGAFSNVGNTTAEVLGKLPVMQHFLFGSILAWDGPLPPPREEPDQEDDAHWGHAHAHAHPGDMGGAGQREVGWGDCCGIPVPSVFGAAAEQAGQGQTAGKGYSLSGVRPVPFD